ncbi:hypothetical protein OSTOST_02340 [Ostertagia ostertagi]
MSTSQPGPKSPSSSTVPSAPATPLSGASRSSSRGSSVTGKDSIDELEGSCCQNTPQISPNVSDVDEGIDDSYSSSFGSFVKGSAAEELLESQVGARSMTESSDVTPVPIASTPSSDSSRSIVELTSSTGNLLYLDVDSRLPFEKLKSWLGQKLSIEPTQFVLIKHYREDDKGYECNNKDEENIRSALDNVFKVGIKLRPPLKDDEKLIRIVQFDLEEPNRENWRVLFECPASKHTPIGDLTLQCIHLYAEIYGQRLTMNQVRLREMPSFSRPMKTVLNPADTLDCRGAQWSNNIYFQIISGERENWRVLFECPASKHTPIGDLTLQCIHLYAEIYGQRLTMNQVRLREMPSFSRPMKTVLNPADTLDCRGAQWSNNIYFQIISDERLIGQPGVPLLVRRFRPSTVEVSGIHEVLVDSKATNQMEAFAHSVSSLSGIPVDRLVFTEIGSSWEKWPFTLSRLSMLDGAVKFSAQPSYAPNDVIERIGGRVVYYKDAAETPKDLSIEDRKQIQIKENGQSMAAVARRKERPLRIQMSSISEP